MLFSSSIIRGRESVESEFFGAGRELGVVLLISTCSSQLHARLLTMAFLFVFQGCASPHQSDAFVNK